MNTQKTIETLNMLVEINNDRIDGYLKATEETNDLDLKNLFSSLIQTSQICKNELTSELRKYGESPEEGTSTLGKAYRIWMDIKLAINSNDRLAILNSCDWGGEIAIETYNIALSKYLEFLNDDQIELIKMQLDSIMNEHNKIKKLAILS
jgi:uncharacterized protein (TIGR02284 family)